MKLTTITPLFKVNELTPSVENAFIPNVNVFGSY